jgi:hypothetical protein
MISGQRAHSGGGFAAQRSLNLLGEHFSSEDPGHRILHSGFEPALDAMNQPALAVQAATRLTLRRH